MPEQGRNGAPSQLYWRLIERLQPSAEHRAAAFRLAELLCCIDDFCWATNMAVQDPTLDLDELRNRLSTILFSGRRLADSMGDLLWLEALSDAYADAPGHQHAAESRSFPHDDWERLVLPWVSRYEAVLGRVRFHLCEAYDDCLKVLASWDAYQEGRISTDQFFWGFGGMVQVQVHVHHHIVGLPNADFAGLLVDIALALEELNKE